MTNAKSKPKSAKATKQTKAKGADPLQLTDLFKGGGEGWQALLQPTIEAQADAATFIGPKRAKEIVPVRELTFQALKPNPPEGWKVVIFGQNPYPRVESATGIAMFDNTFESWSDKHFGAVTSIRCIIKAASMSKYKIPKATSVADNRALLAKHQVVEPPAWFGAMLSQGVLLLNAALTASSDNKLSTSKHTSFWKPIVERIVEEILRAKANSKDKANQGVVFGWWGSHAKNLKKMVEALESKYPQVKVKHVDHCNPAAAGDAFCDGDHLGKLNQALKGLGMKEVDWLPSEGWDQKGGKAAKATSTKMDAFVRDTMDLHKLYLERLQGVRDEKGEELEAIRGIGKLKVLSFEEAMKPVQKVLKGIDGCVEESAEFAEAGKTKALTEDEIAALFMYTTESDFYRELNAAMRNADRTKAKPYFDYLRLFFSALGKIKPYTKSLYRGVALDLRSQYQVSKTVTWWGVSSCTSDINVANGFLGSKGKRMLFVVKAKTAVSIQQYSAFQGEAEYLLAPGTQLKVADVATKADGLITVELEELADKRLVS